MAGFDSSWTAINQTQPNFGRLGTPPADILDEFS